MLTSCSKLSIKTLQRHQTRRSGIFFLNSDHISHISLVTHILTLNMIFGEIFLFVIYVTECKHYKDAATNNATL